VTSLRDVAGPVGWVGAGRMGVPMAHRLLAAGADVRVWNRTPEKARALVAEGAQAAAELGELTDLPVVFTMLMNDLAVREVLLGPGGLLGDQRHPGIVVECSTISVALGQELQERADEIGMPLLHAPVLGNPRHVESGELATIVSGPEAAFAAAEPLLASIAGHVTFAGSGTAARVAKICANILVGSLAETLAELLLIGESHGLARAALLDFLNNSVMGSVWTKAKAKAFVELDFTATFTAEGMRKDLYLAQSLARQHHLAAPLVGVVADQLTRLVGTGIGSGRDFASLLELVAADSGHHLKPEAAQPHGTEP
jgi:3-hydroxyisobutyrate dehydrogenase